MTHFDIICVDDPEMERLWKGAYDAITALEDYANKF